MAKNNHPHEGDGAASRNTPKEERSRPMRDQAQLARMQLGVVTSVGKELVYPRYTLSFEEISDLSNSGASFSITGASRKDACAWLRTAADLIEVGEPLRMRGFTVTR